MTFVVRGAVVIDGTDAPGRTADVVDNGLISLVGRGIEELDDRDSGRGTRRRRGGRRALGFVLADPAAHEPMVGCK